MAKYSLKYIFHDEKIPDMMNNTQSYDKRLFYIITDIRLRYYISHCVSHSWYSNPCEIPWNNFNSLQIILPGYVDFFATTWP